MTFDPAIPQPTDVLSDSQSDLLTNFGQLNTQFSVNHVAFDDGSSDKGKHKFVTFVEQAAAPTTIGDEYALYAMDDSGEPEIFAQPEASTSGFQITKDGALYLRLKPIVAVNFNNAGVPQGSYLGLDTGTPITVVASGRYKLNFSADVQAQLADNNYFWHVAGFTSGSLPCIAQVTNDATYGNVVKTDLIQIDFKDSNNNLTSITRGCAICWRYQ